MLNVIAGIAGHFNSTSLVSIDSATEIYQDIVGRVCDALRDLVPFRQFKKREKHPWWS